ncbi:hypothetical protein C8034_v002213 [Colletotrichum sidae]|uniref:2EXR domain-containing protein n=1 Tax=Colletotrichum sidae TaxID=1347389 RepID=A0A4R8TCS0_9PEZI|nr:hypothetical protein C8034_v002213 [Colletotrichum sidae]
MADSSDVSAIEGAGLLQNDASDSENSVDSGSESGSDDIGTANGLLDIEASESGESDTESDEDSSDSDSDDASILGGGGSGRRRGPRQVFTQFKKLPIELRHRIWHFFCPDLDIHHSPRVLSFQFLCNPKQDVVWEGTVLENQIRAVDVMLAVHHESREIALRAFPDTLVIRQGRRIIHFNKHRDVVQINGFRRPWTHNSSIKGFSENIHNVALEVAHDELIEEAFALLKNLPNLKNVYPIERHNKRRIPHRLRWCASDQIHRYEILQFQKEFNVGEDLHFIYCWPDYQRHREFAEAYVSMNIDEVWDCAAVSAELHDAMQDLFARLRFGRMVCFGWDAADTFDNFLAKHGDDGDDDSSSDDDDDSAGASDDTDVNEYESDGIDDATIDDESVDGEDLEIANDSEDEEDGGASEFAGFSPLRDEDGSMLADAAHFSSPEPEESEEGDAPRRGARNTIVLSEDEEESQESGRGGARRVVLSDDEDEEEEEEPSQTTKRSRRVVLSDDEEDEGEETSRPPRGSGRRARVLPSDDEEDDDEGGAVVNRTETRDDSDTDGGADTKKPLSLAEKLERNRRQNPVSEEEESEEEESNAEEEGEPVRMSLAQRLLAHRRQNPLESESEGDSEGSIDEDDEEDEEEDEEDDDNGMFMNMADEGETDEEQDEEES